jgi:hypothetical protein
LHSGETHPLYLLLFFKTVPAAVVVVVEVVVVVVVVVAVVVVVVVVLIVVVEVVVVVIVLVAGLILGEAVALESPWSELIATNTMIQQTTNETAATVTCVRARNI